MAKNHQIWSHCSRVVNCEPEGANKIEIYPSDMLYIRLTLFTKGSRRMLLSTRTSSCHTKAYNSLSTVPMVLPSIWPFSTRDSWMCPVASLTSFMKSIRQNWRRSSGMLREENQINDTECCIFFSLSGRWSLVSAQAAVWPDWANYWNLDRFSKPLATINLPKSRTFLGNFCKGVKIIHFSSETIFGQLL